MRFRARADDLRSEEVQGLVFEHLRGMRANSPVGHVHALEIEALRHQDVTSWPIWDGSTLCGCAVLKQLDTVTGEIKSMRVRSTHLRQGVGQFGLDIITRVADDRGYAQLLLETGTGIAFEAAHRLYQKNGFTSCGPFGSYKATDFNQFMIKNLRAKHCVEPASPDAVS